MIYVIEGMDVPGVKVPPPNERVLKVILSPELENTENFTLLFSIISQGNSTGVHTHDSDEVMYVASGRGESIIGEDRKEIKVDTVIFAPKLVKHEVKNTCDETLKLICIYIPSLKSAGYFNEAVNKAREYFKTLH